MSESIELNTFFDPEHPDVLFVSEFDLRALIDIIEAHGFEITLVKEPVPEG